jgi:hypothetical protein
LKESKDLRFKWLDHIFKICNSTGMNYLLYSRELESSHQCIKLQFKRILQDQFIQSWFSDMNKSSRGQFYGLFKIEFKLEPYLFKLSQSNFTWLCKLRTCNMKIPIETGRWENIPKCSERIGDELHYLFTCKSTDINLLRCKYIPPYVL